MKIIEAVAACFVALTGCGGSEESAFENRIAVQAQGCPAEVQRVVLQGATQVDYRYQPSTLEELAGTSAAIVAGRLVGIRSKVSNSPSGTTEAYAVLELLVDATYKGSIPSGERVTISVLRSPTISEADLAAASERLEESVTAFAFLVQNGGAPAPAGPVDEELIHRLSAPQGLLLASAECGVRQALVHEPLVASAQISLQELEQLVRSSVD